MRRGSFFWGIILLLVGGLLLLYQMGYLQRVNIWNIIWAFFLIALGAWILWGAVFHKSAKPEHAVVPLDDAGQARLRMQHGAGRMTIDASAGAGNLLEGDFNAGVDVNTRRSGDTLEVKLNTPASVFPFDWSPGQSLDWSIGLARDVPLILEMETGASDARLDFSELRLSELRLKSGASATALTLPANAGFTRVRIESGAASVKLSIPQGVAANIRSHGGLSSINVNERFPRSGDTYRSPDYDSAANKAEIDVEMGVGSVTVA
jgi:LiaI-LiaF-like transmembrane region